MQKSTTILFQMKDMVKNITLEPVSVSGRVPDKCPNLYISLLEIKGSVNIVGVITLKPLGVSDLHFRSQ